MIRFIGDVHGKFGKYKKLLADSPHPTIQVGDMGVGFRSWPHGEWQADPPHQQMVAGGHRFIRGNHDNPAACARDSQWIKDGSVADDMMFIGGAVSIDKAYRIQDYSYWSDEELSQQRLDALIPEYVIAAPKIMVTHECPESIAEMILGRLPSLHGGTMKMDPRFASRTRVAFELMFIGHKPKLWIFGHWHVPFDEVVAGTRFICLPELAYLDIDPASV